MAPRMYIENRFFLNFSLISNSSDVTQPRFESEGDHDKMKSRIRGLYEKTNAP